MPDMTKTLLRRLETYYDAAPRTATRQEAVGPFTLFVRQGAGWPYYARPALGTPPEARFTTAQVLALRERQRALGLPESIEWVHENSPTLRAAVEATGMPVHVYPLLVLDPPGRAYPTPPPGAIVRLVEPDEPDTALALAEAVAHVGFGCPGTAAGEAGIDQARERAAAAESSRLAFLRARLQRGFTRMAAAYLPTGASGPLAPVAVGSHQPVDAVSEVVGVATLPAFRRRGLAGVVVDRLVDDALARGVDTVFLSAGSDDVARVYARLGFRQVGTACVAEAPEDTSQRGAGAAQ